MKKTPAPETQESKGRTFTGTVSSTKMKDTVVVVVERFVKHPQYGKYIKRRKKIKAHDAGNTCVEGQRVTIRETKPISKDKTFVVVK